MRYRLLWEYKFGLALTATYYARSCQSLGRAFIHGPCSLFENVALGFGEERRSMIITFMFRLMYRNLVFLIDTCGCLSFCHISALPEDNGTTFFVFLATAPRTCSNIKGAEKQMRPSMMRWTAINSTSCILNMIPQSTVCNRSFAVQTPSYISRAK